MEALFKAIGRYILKVYRADGTLRKHIVIENAINGTFANQICKVGFTGATAPTAFYIGLIGPSEGGWSDTISTVVASEITLSTYFSQSARQAWTPNAASNGLVTGSTVTFNCTANVTVDGVLLVTNDSVVGGTSGTLISIAYARLNESTLTPVSLISGDTLTVEYSLQLVAFNNF